MNLMHEDLARAQMSERLGEAQTLRRGRRIVVARRMSRRAERASAETGISAGDDDTRKPYHFDTLSVRHRGLASRT